MMMLTHAHAHIYQRPEIKRFRSQGFQFFSLMSFICDGNKATGKHAFHPRAMEEGCDEGTPAKRIKLEKGQPIYSIQDHVDGLDDASSDSDVEVSAQLKKNHRSATPRSASSASTPRTSSGAAALTSVAATNAQMLTIFESIATNLLQPQDTAQPALSKDSSSNSNLDPKTQAIRKMRQEETWLNTQQKLRLIQLFSKDPDAATIYLEIYDDAELRVAWIQESIMQ